MAHNMEHARLKAIAVIGRLGQLLRYNLGSLEAEAHPLAAEGIGVAPDYIRGAHAERIESFDTFGGGHAVFFERHHNFANRKLALEILAYTFRLFGRYSAYLRESLGVVFDYIKGILAEPVNYFDRELRAYTLDVASREISEDITCGRGHFMLAQLHSELAAEGGVKIPMAGEFQQLTGFELGHDTDSGYQLIAAFKLEDRKSVFGIRKGHIVYHAAYAYPLMFLHLYILSGSKLFKFAAGAEIEPLAASAHSLALFQLSFVHTEVEYHNRLLVAEHSAAKPLSVALPGNIGHSAPCGDDDNISPVRARVQNFQ